MQLLKQSTAVTVKLGPFVDDTDGATSASALSISQSDVRISKNFATFGQKSETSSATHDENGWYAIPLNTTDTNTLGHIQITVTMSGSALPVWKDYMVVPANVYDSFIGGSDYLDVNTYQLGGTSQTGNDVGADVNAILTDTGTTLDGKLNTIDANVDAILVDTGTDIPASLTTIDNEIATIDGNVDAILVDTGTNGVVIASGELDQLASASRVEAIQTDLDNPTQYKADVTGLAPANEYDTELSAIQTDLDNPTQYQANVSGLAPANEYDTELSAIQADLDNPTQYQADVSNLDVAVSTRLSGSYINELASASRVEAIQTDLDNPDQYKANVSGLAPANEYDTELSAIQTDLDNPTQYQADVSNLDVAISTRLSGSYINELASASRVEAIQIDLDNPTQYQADVSGLAPSNEYDTELSAIQADLDSPAQYQADVSNLDVAISTRLSGSYISELASASRVEAIQTSVDSIDTNSVLDAIVEDTYTMQDFLKIMGGVLAGEASGGGTTTITFNNLSNSGSIVEATVDSSGNRTTVLLNLE